MRFVIIALVCTLVVAIIAGFAQAIGGSMVDIEQARAQIETARAAQEIAQAAQITGAGLSATAVGMVMIALLFTLAVIGGVIFFVWYSIRRPEAQGQKQLAGLPTMKQLTPGQPAGLDALVQLMILERLERMERPQLPEYFEER